MDITVIQYTTKDAHSEDNASLIRDVFDQLHFVAPKEFGYAVIELAGGHFMHVVSTSAGGDCALTELPAFKRFQTGLSNRIDAAPSRTSAKLVGSYNGFVGQQPAAIQTNNIN